MKQALAAEDLLGRKLGEFVLLEALGQGASGLVFRAEQSMLARQAVIKIARFVTTDASADVAIQRFLGEARLASRIDHPFAAHVYAFGAEPDGLLWIAMELVRGTPLDVFLAEQGPMPIERAVPFLRRLCEVVHTTHEAGIVHRDIKPANVMVVSRAGTMFPKLLDLGVARDLGTGGTEANSPMGTPLYMSPEQWVNPAAAGPPADIYALGALTFEILKGRPPFIADSIRAIAFQHAFAEPPSLGEGFPPELSVAIARAMAKRADERFATAIAFGAALGETSGIALDAFNLPALDEVTRDEVMMHAPQPIAEAVAALEAARSPARARETLWHAARVSAKYVGLVALSCRGRAGSGRLGDAPAVTELLSTLQQGTLDASQWWRLARELCRPFSTMAEVHPIPELVGLFFEGKAELRTAMDALLESREREPAEDAGAEDIRGFLAGAVPAFAQTLRSLRFLHEYRLVVPNDGRDELWMGVRRPIRAATDVVRPRSLTESASMSMSMTLGSSAEFAAMGARRRAATEGVATEGARRAATADFAAVSRPVGARRAVTAQLPVISQRATAEVVGPKSPSSTAEPAVATVVSSRPLLINGVGTAVVSLWPLIQVEPPSPGLAPELFLLDGRGRGRTSARLTSVTGQLERSDDDIWTRLGLGAIERSPTGGRTGSVADEVVASEDDAVPYRGLSTFTESDAGLFFGREREVEGFVNRLRSVPLIAVVGPSGAGKSSFVQAGVLPGLGPDWSSLVVRPGTSPLANLCARLASVGVIMTPGEIRADSGALGRALRARADATGQGMLLVVDQFEELFTLSVDEPEHEAYAQALVEVAPDADDMVRVVITLRDDFLVRAAGLVALRERLAASLQLLTTPVPADLLRILREPARRAGYDFEDDALPKEMVDEVTNHPAALALLSFTAYQLWQFRDRHFRQLPRKAYVALGGVGGALAQHAEATLAAMNDAERAVVREVFRHLVTAGGTRAVLSRAEILQVAGGDLAADPVLEKLIQARLLVAMESAGGGESIEVVHEALLSAWPRLVRWRQEDAEGARLRDQLRAAARQWHERGRGRGLLWRGEALAEYQLWRGRYPGKLTEIEEAFGAHSSADARRGRLLRRGALITVGSGLLVALIIFARLRGVAEAERGRAQTMLETSWYEQGRAASFEHAWKNALPFWSHYLTTRPADVSLRHMLSSAVQARAALIWERSMHLAAANNIVLSRDQRTLLTSGADGSVVFSDAATGQSRWSGSTGGTINALFGSADGFFASGPTGVVELDPSRGVVTRFPHADYWTIGASCGADTVVTVGYGEDKVKVWSRTGKLRYEFALGEDPSDMACRDAEHVLVLTEKHLWDVGPADAHKVAEYAGVSLAISVDHTQIAVAHGTSSTIDLLDASLHVVRSLAGHPSEVKMMAFSPDGKRLLSGDRSGEARVWTLADGAFVQLVGHAGGVTAGAFAANGTPLTLDDEATLRAWTSDGIAITSIDEPGQGLGLVAGDGVAYVAYSDGMVRKHQLAAIDLMNEVPIAYPAACLITNRVGQRVVCGPIPAIEQRGADGSVQRSLDDGLAPGAFTLVQFSDRGDVIAFGVGATEGRFFPAKGTGYSKVVAGSAVFGVAALNDRDWAVAATDARELVVWDHDGTVLRRIPGSAEGAHAIAAHPTRPLIAMPGAARAIVVVDVTTGSVVATLKGHMGEIRGLSFSNDGRTLYSASTDGSVRIWDYASSTQRQVLWGHRGGVEFVEEIAGGLVASAGIDGTVLIWDPAMTVPLRRIVVSRSQPWALEAIDGGAALAILDSFGIRTWRTPLVQAKDEAIRSWLACAVETGKECSLR